MTRRFCNRGNPRGGRDTTGRGQPPKVPCGGRHQPQVRRAGTASHLPAERAHSPPPSRLRPGPRLPFRTGPHLQPHPGLGRGGEGLPREGTGPGRSAGRRRGPEAMARRNEAMARSPGGRCALLLLLQLLALVSAVTPAPQPGRCGCPRGGTAQGPACGGRAGWAESARALNHSLPMTVTLRSQ